MRLICYLSLYQHCHVHEHGVELPDARLQTHDVLVPRLYLIQSLTCDLGIRNYLREKFIKIIKVIKY